MPSTSSLTQDVAFIHASVYLISVILISFTIIITSWQVFRFRERQCNPYRDSNPRNVWILFLVLLCFSLRIYWLMNKASQAESSHAFTVLLFAINRLAFMVLFTAFFIVILGWMSLWTLIQGRTLFSARKLLILVALLYLVQILVILISISDDSVTAQHTTSIWYLVDMVTLSVAGLALSVSFGYYGAKLEPSMAQSFAPEIIRRWRWIRTTCIACFFVRCIVIIYGTMTFTFEMLPDSDAANLVNAICYPAVYYTVPEIVPGIGLLFMLAPPSPPEDSTLSASSEDPEADIRSSGYFGAAFEENLLAVTDRLGSQTNSINSSSPSAVRMGTSTSLSKGRLFSKSASHGNLSTAL